MIGWVDQTKNDHDITARVFDAGDPASGVEFALNSLTADRQSSLELTGLSNGNFVATWETTGGVDGNGRGVYGALFDSTGTRLTPPASDILINETTLDHQQSPSVVALDDGGFIAFWESASNDADGTSIVGTPF